MIVYNKTTLRNLFIQQQAEEAAKEGYFSTAILEEVKKAFPVDLYMPDTFVKIGLALLTVFITVCTFGLVALLFNVESFTAFFVTAGVACYIVLEVMTVQKHHYNSGVDNMLMLISATFILSGIAFKLNNNLEGILSLISFVIFSWFTARFADRLAGILAVISFLSFVFNVYIGLGEFTSSSFPYILIGVSGVLYYTFHRLKAGSNGYSVYQPVFQTISIIGLCAFYLAGNFYVVDLLTDETYLLQRDSALSLSWFFWCWTMIVPVLFLVKGIKDKDVFLGRSGIVFMVVSILTFRYYFHIISTEAAMLIAGASLLIISYFLMKYLRVSKHGFVFDNSNNRTKTENLEAFVIGQSLGHHATPAGETKFGGGNFGGAGAGSDY